MQPQRSGANTGATRGAGGQGAENPPENLGCRRRGRAIACRLRESHGIDVRIRRVDAQSCAADEGEAPEVWTKRCGGRRADHLEQLATGGVPCGLHVPHKTHDVADPQVCIVLATNPRTADRSAAVGEGGRRRQPRGHDPARHHTLASGRPDRSPRRWRFCGLGLFLWDAITRVEHLVHIAVREHHLLVPCQLCNHRLTMEQGPLFQAELPLLRAFRRPIIDVARIELLATLQDEGLGVFPTHFTP
mmetsp:Transcript_66813/g.186484  ORF Transcript_66813/g.186484 Transcript_66813/m.186484 type:complete len:246 (-) Transcript_66813:1019-1756(-)